MCPRVVIIRSTNINSVLLLLFKLLMNFLYHLNVEILKSHIWSKKKRLMGKYFY